MYLSEYQSFVTNPVWVEIRKTLEEVRFGLLDDLKELDPVCEASNIARQQGRLKMLEFVLVLPEDILREINEKLEETTEAKDE